MLCTENFPLPSKAQKIASQFSEKVIDTAIETKSNQDNISLLRDPSLKGDFQLISIPDLSNANIFFICNNIKFPKLSGKATIAQPIIFPESNGFTIPNLPPGP